MPDVQEKPRCGLTAYVSITRLTAGEITGVAADGCFVMHADHSIVFHRYEKRMVGRYQPLAGDFWVIYDDAYQTIMPRWAFEGEHYVLAPPAP